MSRTGLAFLMPIAAFAVGIQSASVAAREGEIAAPTKGAATTQVEREIRQEPRLFVLDQARELDASNKEDMARLVTDLSIPRPKDLVAEDPKWDLAWSTTRPAGDVDFRFLEPKARIYYDTGNDDEGEIDVFDDGGVTVTVNVLEARARVFGRRTLYAKRDKGGGELVYNPVTTQVEAGETVANRDVVRDWPFSAGLALGGGIGAPANDSEDDTESAGNAPILLLTGGVFLELAMGQRHDELTGLERKVFSIGGLEVSTPSVALEAGYAYGLSADESIENADDGAVYVGLGINIPVDWNPTVGN